VRAPGRVAGKVAVVTGGASGIGLATAHALCAEGAIVIVADRDVEGGHAAAGVLRDQGGRAEGLPVDVADDASVRAFASAVRERHGRVDVLHNNAAITDPVHQARDVDVRDISPDVWDTTMSVDVTGAVLMCRHLIPLMLANGGSIINTSSIGGLTGGGPPISYRTSKAAIAQFSRMVATDVAEYGIRVNCIAPGHIATGITNYDLGPTI